jgi:methylmalonyl-CoA mutase cobalamin-binding domain/chain
VNKYTQSEPSPLMGEDGGIMVVDPAVEEDQIARLRGLARVARRRRRARRAGRLARGCAGRAQHHARLHRGGEGGATTGEWAGEMRAVHGEYRGPTGVSKAVSNKTEGLDDIRAAVDAVSDSLGRRLKFLVGKPGLDGHSNGAEQIAFRARDCGMDIAYEGIRLTPREIVDAAKAEGAHVVGLSILSGSHVPLVGELMKLMRAEGLGDIPVMVGRHHSRRGRAHFAGIWCRPGLHAEGFRAQSDHDGYRGVGRPRIHRGRVVGTDRRLTVRLFPLHLRLPAFGCRSVLPGEFRGDGKETTMAINLEKLSLDELKTSRKTSNWRSGFRKAQKERGACRRAKGCAGARVFAR